MAFFPASDSTQWQSQRTWRQCSCRLDRLCHCQDFLCFLWTEDGNEKIFKYIRLIFGATCSPSRAIFVLQKCANDHKQEHPVAYTSIMQQFYMDDFMQTYPSEEEAHRSANEIKTVLHTGGFNLTKFLSNSAAALDNLLEEDNAEMKAQRILGQTLDPKTERLMFAKPKLCYTGKQMTQRKVHSMAASVRSSRTDFTLCHQN